MGSDFHQSESRTEGRSPLGAGRASRCASLVVALVICLAAQALEGTSAPHQTHRWNPRGRSSARSLALSINPYRVNDPGLAKFVGPGSHGDAVLRAQVLLDRAKFSCGEINALYSGNLRKAISAFQKARGLSVNGTVDASTWTALNADRSAALTQYTITQEDVTGPFTKIPREMMEKAKLRMLNYESPLEGLAEKFHANPKLLLLINPSKSFDKAGEQIVVPDVLTAVPPKAASVVVDGSERSVTAYDAAGTTLAYYPATVGSDHDPLPVGTWKILGKKFSPEFHYNPDLFWDANGKDSKATVAPGPKNPVGVVWIALSKEHYGIHGTPDPSLIGRTQSHGCIRLTNWDAAELAQMVEPGTPAILKEGNSSSDESS